MDTTGYILHTETQDTIDMMKKLGCRRIYVEDRLDECTRPKRRIMMKKLQQGDTIVVPAISHLVRSCANLSALLQICHTQDIRIVSLRDRVDTGGILYRDESDKNLINILRQLPYDIAGLRKSIGETRIHIPSGTGKSRPGRDETVINMYISGLSAEDIKRITGVSKRTMYRILQRNNIACDRAGTRRLICE